MIFRAIVLLLALTAGASAQVGIGTQPNFTQLQPAPSGGVTVCGSGWTGPTSGLIGCWPMDAAHVSGTTIQDAIGSNNGTAGAGVTAGTGPSGLANSARTFNGTTQPILLGADPVAFFGAYSVFTWINKTSNTSNDGSDQRWLCWGQGFNLTEFSNASNSGFVDVTAGSGINPGVSASSVGNAAWHQVGLTYDGVSTIVFYLDGSPVALSSPALGDQCDPSVWALGGRNASDRLWAGSMATTVVYNRVLSGAEVTTLFNAF
jgi:hypothetical protein